MPGGDRTGPNGVGPMTGRAAGNCVGNNAPGSANFTGGRGMANRRGNGGGRGLSGRGRDVDVRFQQETEPISSADPQLESGAATLDVATVLNALKDQADSMATTLSGIQQRITKLEMPQSDEKAE